MPKLIIDNREIQVPQGTKVIDAADKLGIMIPRFCYHPALGSIGACRVCAVKYVDGPVKGLRMSCMIDAQDGMVVSTTDAAAVDFRKQVIEWLMINHPHDCPVCDEGGHCLLQDTTIAGGHSIRRFPGHKRTYRDQYLGPLLSHEMNRCIHCYRCARYYQEFTGYRDLGVMGIGNRTYFGRFESGTLESPFSGNLSDICPTGVFTDKPSRYRGRRWDYARSPSICLHCSLGCHLTVSIRFRRIERQEARYDKAVNGYFICDRGRHGFSYAGQGNRPVRARIDGTQGGFQDVLATLKNKLTSVTKDGGKIALAGSTRCTVETQVAIGELCRSAEWQAPVFFSEDAAAKKTAAYVRRLEGDLSISMGQLEQADVVLAVGIDPLNEAPMLAMALRQAWRKGAKIFVLDPRPVTLPFEFTHVMLSPSQLDCALAATIASVVPPAVLDRLGSEAANVLENFADVDPSFLMDAQVFAELKTALHAGDLPVLVCGPEATTSATPELAADCALILRAWGKDARLFGVLNGPNAFGAALMQNERTSFQDILEDIEAGSIRALILVESDPFASAVEPMRLQAALKTLEGLVVIDYLPTRVADMAHYFLPSSTIYEAGGLLVNQEGRLQGAPAAYDGTLSTQPHDDQTHPTREYAIPQPPSKPLPAWQILMALRGDTDLMPRSTMLTHVNRALKAKTADGDDLLSDPWPSRKLTLNGDVFPPRPFSIADATEEAGEAETSREDDALHLIFVACTFGTEELSSMSPCLQELESQPYALVRTSDADSMGLRDGDRVRIDTLSGDLEIDLRVVANMASGVLIVPRHRRLAWQKLASDHRLLAKNRISRINPKS